MIRVRVRVRVRVRGLFSSYSYARSVPAVYEYSLVFPFSLWRNCNSLNIFLMC